MFYYKPKSSDINLEWGRKHLKNTGFWCNVSKNFHTTQDNVREFREQINWFYLSENRKFPFDDDFLTEFEDKIMWTTFIETHKISEATYLKFKKHISLVNFLLNNSEDKIKMLDKYIPQLSKVKIKWYGELYSERRLFFQKCNIPESLIEKYIEDEEDWDYISLYQKLSEKFIKRHYKQLNIKFLIENNLRIPNSIKNKITLGHYG